MRYGFEREFMSDEDVEKTLDALLKECVDDLEKSEARTTIISPKRLEQMQFVHAVLKYITRFTKAKITYELYKPFKTMGSISVEGAILDFNEPEWFARAAEFADSTNIYPITSDKIRIDFTFHGLTVPLSGGDSE